jgi:Cu+-exporting ATPase
MDKQTSQQQPKAPEQSKKASSNTAVDPVCGMDVTTAGNAQKLEKNGHVYYFCSSECREQYEASPDDFDG